ncbi:unnamed protein product [Fraxinus pennsylvanica]|uniref:Uncharacterized protein n=1 Tax=Fraxinus pennsylvanica TaxID=56036 RepID=A0AAD2DZ85_9LAMI|nr:unnamed protein product [Fraxinus pennsylvanica]
MDAIIVLRGNLGAEKFGTLEKDLDKIRETFSYIRRRSEPRRVLEEAETVQKSSTASDSRENGSNNYAEFDIRKILKDEDDGIEEFKSDPSQPYSLGPKISDWDQQRGEWLKNNPNFPNFIAPNKPRVLLVTGSSPKPCENPVGGALLVEVYKE